MSKITKCARTKLRLRKVPILPLARSMLAAGDLLLGLGGDGVRTGLIVFRVC